MLSVVQWSERSDFFVVFLMNVPCKLYPNIKHALTSSSNHSLSEDNNNKSE